MARFNRQEAGEDRLADTLGAATEQLRAAVEREAVEIINRAQEEAASIEEAARRRADEIEQEARGRAEEEIARADQARSAESDRVARLIEDVDVLEDRMRAMVGDLRTRLRSEIEDVPSPPVEPRGDLAAEPEDSAVDEAEPVSGGEPEAVAPSAAGTDHAAMSFSQPVPLSVVTEVDAATERNPVLDDMMRGQIVTMAENGTPRADAERFLSRFRLGKSYVGMLDEIYSQHAEVRSSPAGQGRRRRFKRRGT